MQRKEGRNLAYYVMPNTKERTHVKIPQESSLRDSPLVQSKERRLRSSGLKSGTSLMGRTTVFSWDIRASLQGGIIIKPRLSIGVVTNVIVAPFDGRL